MKNFGDSWKIALSLVMCVTALEASSREKSSCSVKNLPPASCYSKGEPCSIGKPCLGPEVYASRPAILPRTCGGDFIVGAEFLYARPILGGFYLGAMLNRLVHPQVDFTPGARVHVGYSMGEDGWYVKATGTALCPKMSGIDDFEVRNLAQVNVASAFSSMHWRNTKEGGAGVLDKGKLKDFAEKSLASNSEIKEDLPLAVGLVEWTQESGTKDDFPRLPPLGGGTKSGLLVPVVQTTGVSNLLNYGLVDWRWDLRYYLGDVVLGRAYWLSKFVECDLHLGARLVSFEQTWNIDQSQFNADPKMGFSLVELYSRYRGLGQLIGVDTHWHVGCGFALYSKCSVGALYGNSIVTEKEIKAPFASDGGERTRMFNLPLMERKFVSSFLDIGVGVEWDMIMCEGQYAFRVAAGWEGKRFGEQNNFVAFTPFIYPVRTNVQEASHTSYEAPPSGKATLEKWTIAGGTTETGGVNRSSAAVDGMSGDLLLSGWTLGLDVFF